MLEKIYYYFFPKAREKDIFDVENIEEIWYPFPYKKGIVVDSRWFDSDEPGMTVQGGINYGRRLIAQNYDENFQPGQYEDSLEIVSNVMNLNTETQTLFLIWSIGRLLGRARIIRW